MSSRVLMISGSLRAGSTNSAAVKTAAALDLLNIEVSVCAVMDRLPHFNPDDDFDPLPPSVVELREQIAGADALMFCAPEYAGALPGSFKNLLDWTIGGDQMYEKPVAWINVAAPGRGLNAHDSLRKVLTYASTRIVEEACVSVPVDRSVVGEDVVITDPDVRDRIGDALVALAHAASEPAGES